MSRFWDLFAESVIVQSFITAALVIGVLVMWITGRDVPPDLMSALMLVLGFWFGSKTQYALSAAGKNSIVRSGGTRSGKGE